MSDNSLMYDRHSSLFFKRVTSRDYLTRHSTKIVPKPVGTFFSLLCFAHIVLVFHCVRSSVNISQIDDINSKSTLRMHCMLSKKYFIQNFVIMTTIFIRVVVRKSKFVFKNEQLGKYIICLGIQHKRHIVRLHFRL